MADQLRYRRLWLSWGWAMLVVIVVLALKPLPGASIVEIWSDKVWHMLAFLVLMVWFSALYQPRRYWRLFLALLSYGLLIEGLQMFAPSRHVELADVMANMAGAGIGWLLALAGLRRWCAWLEGKLVSS